MVDIALGDLRAHLVGSLLLLAVCTTGTRLGGALQLN